MKVFIFALMIFFLLEVPDKAHSAIKQPVLPAYKTPSPACKAPSPQEFCGVCIQFSEQFLNELLNIVLNAGVIGGCADLCGILAQKTNSNLAGEVCELLCAIEGIREFIKVIQKADLDPIYYCELLGVCEIKDDGDATILSLNVTPKAVPQGSEFEITMSFKTINGTGTGEIAMEIQTMDGVPIGQSNLNKPEQPGVYNVKWGGTAKPDPNCDPSQGPCEMWEPGNYTVNVAVCNGQCGSKHPHSQVYDESSTPFSVVENEN